MSNLPRRKPIPHKRSSDVETLIVADIKAGETVEGATLLHGIHPVTFLRWRRCEQPKDESEGRDSRCLDCRGCRLQQKVDTALEIYKSVLLKRIHNATSKDGSPIWQASAWLLERRFKDEFALKTVIDNRHEVDIGSNNAQKLVNAIMGAATR